MKREIAIVVLFASLTFAFSTLFLFFLGFESLEAMKFGLVATILNFVSISLLGLIVDALFE